MRRQSVGAHEVERVLENMREPHDVAELEGARATLDRMHRAEHGVDRFLVAATGLQLAQAVLEFDELLFALLEEHLADVGLRAHGRLSFTPPRGEWHRPA